MSQDVKWGCPRTSNRDVLRESVTERHWSFPLTVPLCVLSEEIVRRAKRLWVNGRWLVSCQSQWKAPFSIPQEPFHWIVFGRKLGKNLGFVHGRISRSPLSGSEFREWIKIILPCLIFIVNNSNFKDESQLDGSLVKAGTEMINCDNDYNDDHCIDDDDIDEDGSVSDLSGT